MHGLKMFCDALLGRADDRLLHLLIPHSQKGVSRQLLSGCLRIGPVGEPLLEECVFLGRVDRTVLGVLFPFLSHALCLLFEVAILILGGIYRRG